MILICEAERELCQIFRLFLERDGHRCLTAHSRREARKIMDEQGDRLQLLIADYTLPDGFGDELIHEARADHPRMLAILVSGHHHITPPDGAAFLPKPFLPSSLRDMVSAMLDRDPPDASDHHPDPLGGDPAHQS